MTYPTHARRWALVLAAVVLLAGCGPRDFGQPASGGPPPTSKAETAEGFARAILQLVSARRIADLAARVDPAQGLLFSPYGYVDRTSAVVLGPDALRQAWEADTRLLWGHADGTGEPIRLSIRQYFADYLDVADFAKAPEVATNRQLGQGNSPNNLGDVFPNADYVEFHYPGFEPRYLGMDWVSLRIVMRRAADGQWRLLALVNDRWTI